MRPLFSVLPETFFVPLASPNRIHYASCLLLFYRLFQEQTGGVERNHLVSKLAEYLAQQKESLNNEALLLYDELGESELPDQTSEEEEDSVQIDEGGRDPIRALASRMIHKLINYGWFGEEVLPDYTRMITITAHAKPLFEALITIEEGSKIEYESHIVAIYSSICSDIIKDNGHYGVLNAHEHLSRLIDSLKVLSQNIRTHYELLIQQHEGKDIPDILQLHYDHYLEEVIDRAYMRLKTSDNLSRYRPKIIQAINALLEDEPWLAKTANALGMLRREPAQEARKRLSWMLEDIRDQLRLLDPIVADIERRNMLYAKSSMESIKSRIRSDVTVAGRITMLCQALAKRELQAEQVLHHLHRLRWLGTASWYSKNQRAEATSSFLYRPIYDTNILEKEETELRLRLQNHLSPGIFAHCLDKQMGSRDFVWAHEIIQDQDSFVRTLYATLYGENRAPRFPFSVVWDKEEVQAAGWEFRKHGYRRP